MSGPIRYFNNTTGKSVAAQGTADGAGLVIQGLSGEGHVRRLNALNTTYARATNGANFTAVGGVKEVYITILPSAAGVAGDLSKEAILTYDAPSEAVASAFLADTGGQTTDVFQIALPLGIRNGPFFFTEPVNWFDIATDVAATALIEGVTP